MLSSPFDVFGMLKQFAGSVGAFLPEHTGTVGGVVVFALLVKTGVKLFAGSSAKGGSVRQTAAPDSDKSTDAQKSGASNGGEEKKAENKQLEAEKQKEEERRHAQEQLKELFEMTHNEDGKAKQKTQEEKELEELGLERGDLEQLRAQYKDLTLEITSLMEKGLSAEQTAKPLVSKTAEQVPVMELQSLIETMMLFLKKEMAEKNTAVIGMDPQFEQKAALSALKRGDYETALGYLERQAVEAMNKASSSHRSDICAPALEQAASLYRAIGVLARPLDPERSFEALKKSKELAAENTVTDALIARAYYESGKVKKAQQVFENIVENVNENDYAAQYATQMVSQIRTQRVMQQAERIREEYEHRLGDVEGRQKTDQRETLQQRKRAEVMRANSRFIAEEARERDNEREFG